MQHVAQGARGAEEARLAVPRARLLSAGRAVNGAAARALSASPPAGRIGGTLTVPGDKSISHRALDARRRSRAGRPRISGFLAGEDCLATRARAAGARRAHRAPGTDRGASSTGWARDGLRAPRRASGHGQCRHRDASDDGAARAAALRLDADRRCLAHAPADGACRRAAAPDGRRRSRRTTGGRRCRSRARPHCAAIDYALPVASAQVKSAVLLAALTRRRAHAAHRACALARSHRAHAARLWRRAAAAGVNASRSQGGQTLTRHAHCRCRRTSPRRRSSWSPAVWRPRSALVLSNVGVNPTRTGLLELLQRMGADIRVHPRGAPAGQRAEPVADIEVRQSALRGISVPESLVPLAIDEFPVFFVAAACASGETVVRGALELRVKESDRLAAMAAGLDVLGSRESAAAGWPVDPRRRRFRRRHASTATAITASRWPSPSPRSRRAHRSRSATSPTSPPPFRASWTPRARRACRSRPADGRFELKMSAAARCPVVTIDGPSGSGKGTISRAVARAGRLAPARQRRALPPGGARRGAQRRRERGPRASRADRRRHGGVFRLRRRRQRAGRARGAGRDRRDPLGKRRAGRLPGGGLAAGAQRPSGAPASLRPAPRDWWPTGATWGPWSSRRPTSRYS